MLFCEYYEIFKNIYFEEHLRTATSEPTLRDLGRSRLICIKTSKATEQIKERRQAAKGFISLLLSNIYLNTT